MTSSVNLLFTICCLLLVRFRTSSIFDAAVDPIQLKNVTFEHVKGVSSKVNSVSSCLTNTCDLEECLKSVQEISFYELKPSIY